MTDSRVRNLCPLYEIFYEHTRESPGGNALGLRHFGISAKLACRLTSSQPPLHYRKLSVTTATRAAARMTAAPAAPVLSKRKIQRISLADFEGRKNEITRQLMDAATDLGFFMIENTGISQEQVQELWCATAKLRLQFDQRAIRLTTIFPNMPAFTCAHSPTMLYFAAADRLYVCSWRSVLRSRRQSQVCCAL